MTRIADLASSVLAAVFVVLIVLGCAMYPSAAWANGGIGNPCDPAEGACSENNDCRWNNNCDVAHACKCQEQLIEDPVDPHYECGCAVWT